MLQIGHTGLVDWAMIAFTSSGSKSSGTFPSSLTCKWMCLIFIRFIIHLLFLPADNAQVDENKLKGRSLQERRSLQLVSVVAVLVLVRDAAAGFVAAAVEVVDAVVADVAAEKDGVEKIKLVLYF